MDGVFLKIETAFTRDGRYVFETRFSRWVRTFSDDHRVLGVLFRSGWLAVTVGVIFVVMTRGRFPEQTLLVVLVGFAFSVIWFALYDDWRHRQAESPEAKTG